MSWKIEITWVCPGVVSNNVIPENEYGSLLPHSCHTFKKQIDLHKLKERSFFGSRFVCKHLVTDLTPKPTQQRYHCTPRGIEAHAARCWESEELWKSAAGREPTTPSARIPPSLSSANIKQNNERNGMKKHELLKLQLKIILTRSKCLPLWTNLMRYPHVPVHLLDLDLIQSNFIFSKLWFFFLSWSLGPALSSQKESPPSGIFPQIFSSLLQRRRCFKGVTQETDHRQALPHFRHCVTGFAEKNLDQSC